MKTIDWFKNSILYSEKHSKVWLFLGVLLLLGCLGFTIYDWV